LKAFVPIETSFKSQHVANETRGRVVNDASMATAEAKNFCSLNFASYDRDIKTALEKENDCNHYMTLNCC